MADPVHRRIAQVHIVGVHVDFGSERFLAVFELAILHPLEQIQILFDGPVSEGTVFAWLVPAATVLPNFFNRLVANVSLAVFDEFDCPLINLIKIVRGKVLGVPFESKPFNVFTNRVDKLGVFFFRIGIVESKVTFSAKLSGHSKIQAN